MKKLICTFFCLAGIFFTTGAQNYNSKGIYCGTSAPIIIEKKQARSVHGGTVINVTYSGTKINLTMRNAFRYACELWEEQMPTTFPINITVKTSSLADANTLAIVQPQYSSLVDGKERAYLKRQAQFGTYYWNDWADFQNEPDAIITFNNKIPYSYNTDAFQIEQDKYDFITVAIQAIGKALGFYFQANYEEDYLVLQENANSYSKHVVGLLQEKKYSDAIASSPIYLSYYTSNNKWPLYSSSSYEAEYTFSYFSVDASNEETAFMQLGISKGTAIRHIGSSMRDVFSIMGWGRATATDIKEEDRSYESVSVADAMEYMGYDGYNGSSIPISYIVGDNGNDYFYSRTEERSPGQYVLLKDGRWQSFKQLTHLNPENDSYKRTSDGYLRLMYVSYSYGPGMNYKNLITNFELYKFPPQAPSFEINQYKKSTSANARMARRGISTVTPLSSEVIYDVEIGFEHTEGCKSILVEQTDEDWPVAFTYEVDPNEGCFIAQMSNKYKSTFRLTYKNDEGERTSPGKTFNLSSANIGTTTQIAISPNANYIKYEQVDSTFHVIDSLVNWNYKIVDLKKSKVTKTGNLTKSSGTIELPSTLNGIYGISINTEDSVYSTKWTNK